MQTLMTFMNRIKAANIVSLTIMNCIFSYLSVSVCDSSTNSIMQSNSNFGYV